MKMKIYEVSRVRNDGKDEHKLQFWYLDYADAVDKFKKLVAEEEQVDWIAEGFKNLDDEEHYSFICSTDIWMFASTHNIWDVCTSIVDIKEREVF